LKILLTGASGFVGSHILDSLRAGGLETALLLRPNSNKRFIESHLASVEMRSGSIDDPESVRRAMAGITHVIHCAGATRACRISDFYTINQGGTRHVVDAVNAQQGRVQRFVHISSLAAAGPAVAEKPAVETDPARPVSHYGKSKLAGEREVRTHCRAEHVILRPAGVYGPRDGEFLRLFRAVKSHLLPKPAEKQALSLVFAKDLANAVLTCLRQPVTAGKTYFVAARQILTARFMAAEIAAQMKVWTFPLPLPTLLLWPVCLAQEVISRLTGKASVLSLQKFAELRAPGWVCDPGLLERDTGYACPTGFSAGAAQTLAWYREYGWL
jgi:2-alkyl-3-oxoalkanoate reductase